LFTDTRTTPRTAALAAAQQKTRRGNPARASGAVSVNKLFWKILVTRVKRKMRSRLTRWWARGFSLLPGEAGSERTAGENPNFSHYRG
jgi:hypothetical protein